MTTTRLSTMRHAHRLIAIAILSFALTACAALTALNYISSALNVVLEFVPIPGLPPAVITYFSSAAGCVAFAAEEMATMDSDAVKGAKITAQCAALVQAKMPAGTPQYLVDLAAKLATKIADILAHVPSPTMSANGKAVSAGKPTYTRVTEDERVKLSSMQARALAAKARIDATPTAVTTPAMPAAPATPAGKGK